MKVADGSSAAIEEKATIPLNIWNKTWVGDFYFVPNLPHQAILAVNTMKELGMKIDFSVPSVTLKGPKDKAESWCPLNSPVRNIDWRR